MDTFAKSVRARRCLMAKTRREFSSEFKREAVALLESSGRPLTRVASEVGILLNQEFVASVPNRVWLAAIT